MLVFQLKLPLLLLVGGGCCPHDGGDSSPLTLLAATHIVSPTMLSASPRRLRAAVAGWIVKWLTVAPAVRIVRNVMWGEERAE